MTEELLSLKLNARTLLKEFLRLNELVFFFFFLYVFSRSPLLKQKTLTLYLSQGLLLLPWPATPGLLMPAMSFRSSRIVFVPLVLLLTVLEL